MIWHRSFLLFTQLKQAKKDIAGACKAATTYLTGASSSSPSNADDSGGSTNSSLFEGTWLRSIIGISMKPSRSLMCSDSSDSSDDEKSEDERESDCQQPSGDQIEEKKDATQEQAGK